MNASGTCVHFQLYIRKLKLTQALQHSVELTCARGPSTLFSTNLKVNCYYYDEITRNIKCKKWRASINMGWQWLNMKTIYDYSTVQGRTTNFWPTTDNVSSGRVKNRIKLEQFLKGRCWKRSNLHVSTIILVSSRSFKRCRQNIG